MRRANVRQSRPDYSLGLHTTNGGLGPVARRGWDDFTARMLAQAEQQGSYGLRHFYQSAPLRLLRMLCEVHPMAKMAHSNNAADVCLPGSTKIVAIRHVTKTVTTTDPQTGVETTSEETSEEIDSAETEKLQAFLDQYPGGLPGLQRACLKQLEWAGTFCLEAVPAGRGKGVARGITFDPLTLLFYPREDGGWDLRQATTNDWAASRGSSVLGETPLDPETTFVLSLDYDDDNPNGMPWFGAFLQEGLKDLGQERNLSDILRAWAYPHLRLGFPVDETLERAKNNPGLLDGKGEYNPETGENDDLTPEEYVELEFERFCDWLSCINPDDPLVTPKGTEAGVLDGGSGLAALDPMLKMRRHRMVMGLDQLPNRVGITDGGTQAYADQQARQDARKLEFARFLVNAGPVWLCNLHLRLQGKDLKARADVESILPADRLTNAKARALEVATDTALVNVGAMDPEERAVTHTGSGQHDPSRAYNTPPAAAATAAPADDNETEDDGGGAAGA